MAAAVQWRPALLLLAAGIATGVALVFLGKAAVAGGWGAVMGFMHAPAAGGAAAGGGGGGTTAAGGGGAAAGGAAVGQLAVAVAANLLK